MRLVTVVEASVLEPLAVKNTEVRPPFIAALPFAVKLVRVVEASVVEPVAYMFCVLVVDALVVVANSVVMLPVVANRLFTIAERAVRAFANKVPRTFSFVIDEVAANNAFAARLPAVKPVRIREEKSKVSFFMSRVFEVIAGGGN